MIFRFTHFIILFFLTVSCSQVAIHEKVADQKIFGFAKEVRKTDHLELFMYGGGLLEQINSFNIGFISHELVDIDEARQMYIDISNRFLNYINSDTNVCEYSSVFPFTIKQLNLVIMYEPDPNHITGPYIGVVSMGPMYLPQRDRINYHQDDPATGKSKIVFTENYNKALDILNFQQCKREMDAELQFKSTFELH